jgi:hypothetical protein
MSTVDTQDISTPTATDIAGLSYYEAKRRIVEHRFAGFDGTAVPSHAGEILAVLGWPEPAPVMDDKKPVKVFTFGIHNGIDRETMLRTGHVRGTRGAGSAAFVVATTKKDAITMTTEGWFRKSAKTTAYVEVSPTDYRYRLAAEQEA